jgi:hypothetical protein
VGIFTDMLSTPVPGLNDLLEAGKCLQRVHQKDEDRHLPAFAPSGF